MRGALSVLRGKMIDLVHAASGKKFGEIKVSTYKRLKKFGESLGLDPAEALEFLVSGKR